ncbi:MAG: iron ABC transporter permease [Planctomycetota bacterium]|mgnify:CR=1 FL=1
MKLAWIWLTLLFLGAMFCALLFGSTPVQEMSWNTFIQVRLIRVLLAAIAGASLAVAGALMQGLFRNPLASPSIAGVNAGGIFGGQIALLLHQSLYPFLARKLPEEMFLPMGVFVGSGFVLFLLLSFLKWMRTESEDLLMILLMGLMLSNFFSALTGIITLIVSSDWALHRSVIAFSYGHLDGKGLNHLLLTLPLFLGGFFASMLWSRSLDLMLSGEEEATSLGVDLRHSRRWILTWTSILVTAAVSVGGGVAFVGLVVPHFMRLWAGSKHQRLIPFCAIGGAIFLMSCDLISRLPLWAAELPLGSITAIIGAPLFIYLFFNARKSTI